MADKPKLPLRLRVDIRDNFLTGDSRLPQAISNVQELLGHPVRLEPLQWEAIWAVLSVARSESGTPDIFVPSVRNIAIAFFEDVLSRLASTAPSAEEIWTENLLTALEGVGKLSVWIEPIPDDGPGRARKQTGRPKVVFDKERMGFVIYLPNSKLDAVMEQQLVSVREGFDKDLSRMFGKEESKEDDWSDVAPDNEAPGGGGDEGKPGSSTSVTGAIAESGAANVGESYNQYDQFPTLSSLPRPDILFKNTLPYILIITSPVHSSIHISCSHHPTLRLIQSYIEKHSRPHPHRANNTPMAEVDPVVSDISGPFAGKLYAGIVVNSHARTFKGGKSAGVNGAWLMTFVEGVLGYKFMERGDGAWVYRRDKRFGNEGKDAFE